MWGTSPRRRVFLAGTALLTLLLVAAAVLLTRVGPEDHITPAPQDKPGPVVLVPGYGGGVGGLEVLAERLRALGRQVTVFRLPGNGTGDLEAQADSLNRTVRELLAQGAPSVDLVGYSAGGIVVRLWVREHDGREKARRIVLLGTPNHGASIAAFAARFAASECPRACQELAPNSDLLDRLNSGDETPSGPRWVSIWTDQDEVVTPPNSARLKGAVDLTVQQVCPGHNVGHGQLPTDSVVFEMVRLALTQPNFAPFRLPGC